MIKVDISPDLSSTCRQYAVVEVDHKISNEDHHEEKFDTRLILCYLGFGHIIEQEGFGGALLGLLEKI
jgi:hypothetical protein